jgi:hypothetical protein
VFAALPQSLEAVVGDITGNRGLGEFFAKAPANNNAAASSSSSSGLRPAGKTVIIMDEVDGMGGNEVSGGRSQAPAAHPPISPRGAALFTASAEAPVKHATTHPRFPLSLPCSVRTDCCRSGSWWNAGAGGAHQVDANANHLYCK